MNGRVVVNEEEKKKRKRQEAFHPAQYVSE